MTNHIGLCRLLEQWESWRKLEADQCYFYNNNNNNKKIYLYCYWKREEIEHEIFFESSGMNCGDENEIFEHDHLADLIANPTAMINENALLTLMRGHPIRHQFLSHINSCKGNQSSMEWKLLCRSLSFVYYICWVLYIFLSDKSLVWFRQVLFIWIVVVVVVVCVSYQFDRLLLFNRRFIIVFTKGIRCYIFHTHLSFSLSPSVSQASRTELMKKGLKKYIYFIFTNSGAHSICAVLSLLLSTKSSLFRNFISSAIDRKSVV